MLAGYIAKNKRKKNSRRRERQYFQDAARVITFGDIFNIVPVRGDGGGELALPPAKMLTGQQVFPAGYMTRNGQYRNNPRGWDDPRQPNKWAGPPPGSIVIPATTDPKKRGTDITTARQTQYRRQRAEKDQEKAEDDYDKEIWFGGIELIYPNERNTYRLLQRAIETDQANGYSDRIYYRTRLKKQINANRNERAEYWPGGTQGGACPYTRINTITPCPDYSPSLHA
jgi:hypothetical protein